jgi:hypothetical protein
MCLLRAYDGKKRKFSTQVRTQSCLLSSTPCYFEGMLCFYLVA